MAAARATFLGLPAATRRSKKFLNTTLWRTATSVATYRVRRTSARPPQMVRWPRTGPESR